MKNYHWKLIRQSDQQDWPEMAPTPEGALKFLKEKIGMQLEICEEMDQYDYILERHHEIENRVSKFIGKPEAIFPVRRQVA